MTIPGLPYVEPAFASIEPMSAVHLDEKEQEVQGVAYLITRAQYAKVVASEGGDIAYTRAKLRAKPLEKDGVQLVGGKEFVVFTLINAIYKAHPGRPSRRYMV
jgi:gliotoxin/aspirochlorine biosynthesis gamma-glutamylcyclotransferase